MHGARAELLDDPRATATLKEFTAEAMDELVETSPPGPPGEPLRIPRSHLDALVNL